MAKKENSVDKLFGDNYVDVINKKEVFFVFSKNMGHAIVISIDVNL